MNINFHTANTNDERFQLISYLAILFMLIGSIIYIYLGNIATAIAEILMVLLLTVNLFSTRSLEFKIHLFLAIASMVFIYLLYSGGIVGSGWLWSMTIPSITNLLLSRKLSTKYLLGYGAVLSTILLLQISGAIHSAYTNFELLLLLILFTFNSYVLYAFQTKLSNIHLKLSEVNIALKDEIAREVEQNSKKNKILSSQAKQAQMGEMVSMIAHQWRQPLNAISASAIKLKLENDLGAISSKSIDESSIFIQDRTQDMSEIINNFLDYSKPSNDSIYFYTEELIKKTYAIIETQFSLRGIFLTLNYAQDAKDTKVFGVENLLEQVLLNLLLNIRDAFDDSKKIAIKNIYISINKDNSISIEDNAGGIPKEQMDKVFNPYFTTKEEGKGTGLGLYMSRKIMRDNFDGDLLYAPLPDGCRFTIILKALSKKEEDEPQPAA